MGYEHTWSSIASSFFGEWTYDISGVLLFEPIHCFLPRLHYHYSHLVLMFMFMCSVDFDILGTYVYTTYLVGADLICCSTQKDLSCRPPLTLKSRLRTKHLISSTKRASRYYD
jgi:hypothetical protein